MQPQPQPQPTARRRDRAQRTVVGLILIGVLVFVAMGGTDRCGGSLLPQGIRETTQDLLATAADWDAELRGGDRSASHFHDGMEMSVAGDTDRVSLAGGGIEVRVPLTVSNVSTAVRPTRLMWGWLRFDGSDGGLGEAAAPAAARCSARPDVAPGAEAEIVFCFRVPEGAPHRFDDLVVKIGPVATLVFEP